jgi:hypothetical protein
MELSKKQEKVFLDISVQLTGFSELELLGTGMLQTYFNVMMNKNNMAVVVAFLAEAESILKKNKDNAGALKNDILNNLMPDNLYSGLAKNIITMWYMGSWLNDIITPQSYVQGMVWGVADAHPPGAKQPGYASWAIAPLQQSTK